MESNERFHRFTLKLMREKYICIGFACIFIVLNVGNFLVIMSSVPDLVLIYIFSLILCTEAFIIACLIKIKTLIRAIELIQIQNVYIEKTKGAEAP